MKKILIFLSCFLVFLICIRIINKYYEFYYENIFLQKATEHTLKYIPKKIFQTCRDKTKLHTRFKENIEYIKNLNPTWEYKLYDDEGKRKYIKKNYSKEILQIYNLINPKYGPAKSDFFRYLLMYKEGGVYFDIKSACKYPLEKIIASDEEFILSYWKKSFQLMRLKKIGGEFIQWCIICRPKHPFLYKVIKNVIKNIREYSIEKFGTGKNGVLKLTGPIVYTNTIDPLIKKYNCKVVYHSDILGLIYNNCVEDHTKMFGKTHYSNLSEPIVIYPKDTLFKPKTLFQKMFIEPTTIQLLTKLFSSEKLNNILLAITILIVFIFMFL